MSQPAPNPPATPSLFARAYPEQLKTEERALVEARRRVAGLPPGSDRQVGVGLSGGGIRSATFSLGLFQGLARKTGLLRRIDFLSTVSGGGYFGAFFGRLFGRPFVQTPADVEAVLKQEKKPKVLAYLRENGRYLSPNGAGDLLLAGAILLRNWVSIHLVLILFLLAAFLALQSLRVGLESISGFSTWFDAWTGMGGSIWWSPFLSLPLVMFLLVVFPIGWAYWLIPHESRAVTEAGAGEKPGPALARRWKKSSIPEWTGLTLVLALFLWLTLANWDQRWFAGLWGTLTTVTISTFIWWQAAMRRKLPQEPDPPPPAQEEKKRTAAEEKKKIEGALYRDLGRRNRLGLWVTWSLVATAGLLAIGLIDSLGQTLYFMFKGRNLGVWLAGIFSSWAVLAGFAQRIAVFFSKGPQKARPSLPLKLMTTVVALIVVMVLLVSVDAASHAIAWKLGGPPGVPALLRLGKNDKARKMTVEVRGDQTPILPLSLSLRSGVERDPKAGDAESTATTKTPAARPDPGPAILGLVATFLLSLLFGQTWPFVNNSSHQSLYSARLTRAYLGASNPKRLDASASVTEVVSGDDADLAHYWPPPAKKGAPIHLINVTINETMDGRSQVEQKDRKGNGMALGPCGLSVNVEHHLLAPLGKDEETDPVGAEVDIYPRDPKDGFRVFDYPTPEGQEKPVFTGEMLPLGSWVGISGAAFSTGTGAQTSLGLSLLAGMGNVRLGRWWDSGVVRSQEASGKPRTRPKLGTRFENALARIFPVQVYLLDEFLARFPGTARRHWYLSDGGHFENMGGYELLRRRLPMIVIVDAEQDADYTFGGLSNLVRKARLDFGAEIEFLSERQLDQEVDASVRPHFGTLEQLRRGVWKDGKLVEADPAGLSVAHAALAWITYDSMLEPRSRLLYIKPTLTGDEPEDVLQYHQAHPAFPHEPTSDQFFDEAQWESYRRLGEHVAAKLFEAPTGKAGAWCPSLLADGVAP
jgi:hypothetical protein